MTHMSESGSPIEPLYGPESLQGFDPDEELGEPGEYPYTRGVYPGMYTKRPWTMRQYAGFSTAADSNRRYHQLIKAGTTGLSVAFDLPTQMGYDSDAPAARGEGGKGGVGIDSIADMRLLYQLVAEKQGIAAGQLTGTIQNDILKEYIARGTYISPPQPSLRLV